jgi:alpha-D-ribose 1-methylphosphonate 5-triphosphate synthase subunit PhnH
MTGARMSKAHMSEALTAGFADPVADAQECFRAVLAAMSRPGSVHPVAGVAAPAPLCGAAAAVLLTLVDQEAVLWLDPAAEAARGWLAFHTGASIGEQRTAGFVLALALPPLDTLAGGTDEAPEHSATVILQVASVTEGRRFVLEGPGLREPALLAVTGLPEDFASVWAANHVLYPCGVDLVLCAGNALAALPRSVSIREG